MGVEKEEPRPHFLAKPPRGGIEGQGWRGKKGEGREGGNLGGYCLLRGIIGPVVSWKWNPRTLDYN